MTELCSKGTRARKLVITAVLVLAGGAMAVGYALGRLPRLSKATIWTIGVCSGNSPFSPKPLGGACIPVLSSNDVTDVPARYVADPFLLRREGRWWLFFEVLDGRTGRGEIGLAESPDARRWTYRGIILREPFHLSFPCVFEWQGEVYLVPESAAARSIRLYRAAPFPTRWVWTRDILSGRPFTDSTLFRHQDRWWLFTTSDPQGNGSLSLYSSKDLEGAWAEHPKSPVVRGNPHGARPAGRVLSIGGRLFRFGQDDSPRYGLKVRVFEITTLTASDYSERPGEGPALLEGSGTGWNRSGMHHIDIQPETEERWIASVDGQVRGWRLEWPAPTPVP